MPRQSPSDRLDILFSGNSIADILENSKRNIFTGNISRRIVRNEILSPTISITRVYAHRCIEITMLKETFEKGKNAMFFLHVEEKFGDYLSLDGTKYRKCRKRSVQEISIYSLYCHRRITLIPVIIRREKTVKRSVLKMKLSYTVLIPSCHLSFADARFFSGIKRTRRREPRVVGRLY